MLEKSYGSRSNTKNERRGWVKKKDLRDAPDASDTSRALRIPP